MYIYEDLKPEVFKEKNQQMFLSIRDRAFKLCEEAGCARMGSIIAKETGDSWKMLACVDRLVELGELYEIKYNCTAQHRIFVRI